MKTQKAIIDNIPMIIWGENSNKVYIHVHGKMSCKEYAEDFAKLAEEKGYQTLSFDLPEHGERKDVNYCCDIWNGMNDLSKVADYAFSKWQDISLFACSLGAFFSLNTYDERKFTKCLFQSPILNMKWLIEQMFVWFNVTEESLQTEKEIPTPIDTLRWDYYQYVLNHPVTDWKIPTAILYGRQDNLQSIELIQAFADKHNCNLTTSQNSEHSFMASEDGEIVRTWLEKNI